MIKTFDELIEPYKENIRTVEAQIVWLRNKRGFAPQYVEQAMEEVYTEMDQGKTFSNGTELDHYLAARAKEIREEDMKGSIERMQNRITKLTSPPIEGGRWKKAWLAITGKI